MLLRSTASILVLCGTPIGCLPEDTGSSAFSAASGLFGFVKDSGLRDAAVGVAGAAMDQFKRWMVEKQVLRDLPHDYEDLEENLFGAQLSSVAYALDLAEIRQRTAALGCHLQHFEQQRAFDWMRNPQWFTCERSGNLYVVFRGTHSVKDGLADIMLTPQVHTTGDKFHSGFLEGAKMAWQNGLEKQLSPNRVRGRRVTILGHSYGGALALTLMGMDVLPASSGVQYRVITFGSPAVFYGDPKNCALLQRAKVTQWVLQDDPLPRVLGSDYPALQALASKWLPDSLKDEDRIKLLDQLAKYVHLDKSDMRLLRDNKAYSVPAQARKQILHIHGALLSLVLKGPLQSYSDHKISAYIAQIKELLKSSRFAHRQGDL